MRTIDNPWSHVPLGIGHDQRYWNSFCSQSFSFAVYKDFGDRFLIVEEKLPAIDMVRKAMLNRIVRFTKQV